MADHETTALVLAAGKGTRMFSSKPKVLQTLLGEPMLYYVYQALLPLFGHAGIKTIVGYMSDEIEKAFPGQKKSFVKQDKQLGTGHALQVAWDAVKAENNAYCLVVNGDTPLVDHLTLEDFLTEAKRQDADLAFLSITPPDPASFGRVIRDENKKVLSIVEAKDFDPARHGEPTGEVNAGIYLLKMNPVEPLLGSLSNRNNSGEYYITDLVEAAIAAGLKVVAVNSGDNPGLMGINSPIELARAESTLRERIVAYWLAQGVVMHFHESVVIGPKVSLSPETELTGPCELYGKTVMGRNVFVGSHTWIKDTVIDAEAKVLEFSHIQEAVVGERCVIGPYARLRPGAVLDESSKVGNFVEMKKARLGAGSKASHLSYLGDSIIGRDVNIGAGTITCNYDGKNKHVTTIEDNVFIGSNTALVAPVTIEKGGLVAAGSVITKNVPQGALAVGRAKQSNIIRKPKKP